jgi:hypothetical protein
LASGFRLHCSAGNPTAPLALGNQISSFVVTKPRAHPQYVGGYSHQGSDASVMTRLGHAVCGGAIAALVLTLSWPGRAQGTAEQRSACTADALRLCSAEIPNVSRITSCMKAKFSQLSLGCKAAVTHKSAVNRR